MLACAGITNNTCRLVIAITLHTLTSKYLAYRGQTFPQFEVVNPYTSPIEVIPTTVIILVKLR